MTELTREPVEIEIQTAAGERLLVKIITARNGRPLIAIAPQFLGRELDWQLRHSALVIRPEHAGRLTKAITRIAASLEGGAG